jgi:DNA polymerase/3'-5' exonuclease PolX
MLKIIKMDQKENIIKFLKMYRHKSQGNIYKVRAYDKVIKNIERFSGSIREYEDIKNIEGIGERIEEKIKKILKYNKKSKYDSNIYEKLIKIYGVGDKKAQELIRSNNIKSIEDLRDKVKKNVKILTQSQLYGLYCYEDLLERIPRVEMKIHKQILNLKNRGKIVGSFRRGCANSSDIDVMLNMNKEEFNNFVDELIRIKYIKYILARGEKKVMAICKIKKYRRIDIVRNSDEEYPYMLLYFTGPMEFNISFRQHCLKKGLSLSEYGFKPTVKGLKTEEDIFLYVGLNYVKPEERKYF